MKKIKSIIVVTLLAACFVLMSALAAGCGDATTLELDTSNAVTIFAVNEEFSSEGLVLYEKQSDGNNVRVKTGDYTVSAPDTSTAGEKEVTVTYGDKQITYKISVVVPEVVATFTGDIICGTGSGNTTTFSAEFKCYNTLKWELWYAIPGWGGSAAEPELRDTGRYTIDNGVYHMIMTITDEYTEEKDGVVSFMYTGVGLDLNNWGGSGNFYGTMTLQDTPADTTE